MDLWWNMIKAKIIYKNSKSIDVGFLSFIEGFSTLVDATMKKMADDFKIDLIFNITSQKFAGTFDPLSEVWSNWKADHGLPGDFWKAFGYLSTAFSVGKIQDGHGFGVKTNVLPGQSSSIFGKNTITPIWEYIFHNEYGRGAFEKGRISVGLQPARPVFGPTRVEAKEKFWNAEDKRQFHSKVSNLWEKVI